MYEQEYKQLLLEGPSIFTNKKRFPQVDLHQQSQIRVHMDDEKRLKTNYMEKHIEPIQRYHSPGGHDNPYGIDRRTPEMSRLGKPYHAAGVRNLQLETDNQRQQSRSLNRAGDSSRNALDNLGVPPNPAQRHASVSGYGIGGISGAHLNRSRRRILNDYVTPSTLQQNGSAIVLANKNAHAGLLPQNINNRLGPLPTENSQYMGPPLEDLVSDQQQYNLQNMWQSGQDLLMQQRQEQEYAMQKQQEEVQNRFGSAPPQAQMADQYAQMANKSNTEEDFNPPGQQAFHAPQHQRALTQETNPGYSPGPAVNNSVNFGSPPPPAKPIENDYFDRLRGAQMRHSAMRKASEMSMSMDPNQSPHPYPPVEAERQLQNNPRARNPMLIAHQHQLEQHKQNYKAQLDRQLGERKEIINRLDAIQKNYGQMPITNTATQEGAMTRAAAVNQFVGLQPGQNLPTHTQTKTSAHPHQHHAPHMGGGGRQQLPPRDSLGFLASQSPAMPLTIPTRAEMNKHIDFRSHYI